MASKNLPQALQAEIITIGDELLYGQITDSNAEWIGKTLAENGFRLVRKSTVGDTQEDIMAALDQIRPKTQLVLITGGLGPTKDDITKKTLAEYFGVGFRTDEGVMAHLEQIFARRNREMTQLNRMQANLPSNAKVLHNAVGTAPGMWFDDGRRVIISMPGVPYEMRHIVTERVLPLCRERFELPVIHHRMIRVSGVPESRLSAMLEEWEASLAPDFSLAYLPRFLDVRLRLTAIGVAGEEVPQKMEAKLREIEHLLGDKVSDWEGHDVETTLANFLKAHQQTLATAESCTGGLIAHQITRQAGSSAYFQGGVVAYANAAKEHLLGVSPETLANHGAVSEQTAREMAQGVREKLGTDYGIATTGIAGPDGAVPGKPVGTVWIGFASRQQVKARLFQITTDRMINIRYATMAAMNYLLVSARKELHQSASHTLAQ